MAVYRNDQVDFSFSSEVALGGYFAPAEATRDDGGASTLFDGLLNGSVVAGARTIVVDGDTMAQLSTTAPNESYIIIGHSTIQDAGHDDISIQSEIRKVINC